MIYLFLIGYFLLIVIDNSLILERDPERNPCGGVKRALSHLACCTGQRRDFLQSPSLWITVSLIRETPQPLTCCVLAEPSSSPVRLSVGSSKQIETWTSFPWLTCLIVLGQSRSTTERTWKLNCERIIMLQGCQMVSGFTCRKSKITIFEPMRAVSEMTVMWQHREGFLAWTLWKLG